MQFYILTYTYLLFSNKMRPALVASLSLPLSSHTSASVLFHLTFKPKKRIQERKNVRKMRTLLLKHTYIQNVKKKKMTVIFKKKKRKKESCSLFSRFVRL